jgi:hypothetical protein
VDVASASGRRALLAVRVAGGWWTVARGDDGVALRPAGGDELVAELALAIAG